MARQQYNDGQEIVFEDFNKSQARTEQELYDRVIYELVQQTEDAFFDDGFLVSFASPSSVTVGAGSGFQTDGTVSAEEPQKRLLYLASAPTVNLTAADGSNDRIDIICVKHGRADGGTENRKFKDAGTGTISTQPLVVENDWSAEVIVVDGVPAISPVAPAVPAGYIGVAELLVSAVTGLSGAGAVTDTRSLMPIGGEIDIDTLAFQRVTQDAALNIKQVLAELDQNQVAGRLDTNEFVDSVTDPTAPTVSKTVKLFNKDGLLYKIDDLGVVTPVGSGAGGGGGGANWQGDALEDEEFNEKVWKYTQGGSQQLDLYIKVPQGYLEGEQIKAFLGFYSSSASDDFKMQLQSSLVRREVDAIDSIANQNTDDSGDITNTLANMYREVELEVTNALGQINAFQVQPGDLIRLRLTRAVPAGTDDSAEIRFVPSSTEVTFG